jgi:hypothetical protein
MHKKKMHESEEMKKSMKKKKMAKEHHHEVKSMSGCSMPMKPKMMMKKAMRGK